MSVAYSRSKGSSARCTLNGQIFAFFSPIAPRGCPIEIHYHNGSARCAVRLGDAWRVRPEETLLAQLRDWLSPEGVELRYG